MPDKLAQLRNLILAGYTVTSIDSDHDCVVARLERAGQFAVVRLHRSDAQRLLFEDQLSQYR